MATKRLLDSRGLSYVEKSIEEQPAGWLDEYKTEGHMSAPIVTVDYPESGGQVVWSDLRPDVISELVVK